MTKLYTINHYNLYDETIDWEKYHFRNINVKGEKMDVFFCKNEDGRMFVVAGKRWRGSAYRSCGHWHSGESYYDIYFRKEFKTREEGNAFYKQFRATMAI